jgi:hypothetical protein
VKIKLLSQEIGRRSGNSNNGELKLRMPFPKLLSGEDISIKLYLKNIESQPVKVLMFRVKLILSKLLWI